MCAETTAASNTGALTVLERLGFDLTRVDDGGGVHALLVFKTQL